MSNFDHQPVLPLKIKQPNAAELEPYIPIPERYLQSDIPHHGVIHGEETAIWTGVLIENLPPEVRAQIDGRVVLNAAAYHDSGRLGDWRNLQGETRKHGPRGAELFREQWDKIDPTLSDEQVESIAQIIHRHTPTLRDRAAKRRDKEAGRNFDDYIDPNELMLHIVQDADTLGLVRGLYSRKVDSTRPVPYAVFASRVRKVKNHLHVREGSGLTLRNLRFPITTKLYPAADALAKMSRTDPDIDRRFTGHRSGAALESAQRLGIVKR